MDRNSPSAKSQPPPALEPEDFYFEGANMVFTAVYHLKRGSCCKSGCRHCPYGFTGGDALPTAAPSTHSAEPPPEG